MPDQIGAIWQAFIRSRMAPGQLETARVDSSRMAALVESSAQNREDFIHGLMAEVSLLETEDRMRVMVSGLQTLLCFLMNEVEGYLNKVNSEQELSKLYEQVLGDLESNLTFLKDYFPRYFDLQLPAPKTIARSFHHGVDQLENQLNALEKQNDPQLIRLVLSVFHGLIDQSISFGKLSYLNHLLEGLMKAATNESQVRYGSGFMDWCIVQNLNAPVILQYITDHLSAVLLPLETDVEKLDWLTGYQKYLRLLPEGETRALNDHLMAVKDYLLHWAELEKILLHAEPKKENTVVTDTRPKINTSVSVPVLALYVRLFKEAGIFTNTNAQELFRAVSASFTTQRKAEVAHTHLHSKFYAIEESARRKVFDQLMEMAHLCKRIA